MRFKGVHTEMKNGAAVHYYRANRGRRIRLPDDPDSEEFAEAVKLAATMGQETDRPKRLTAVELRRQAIGAAIQESIKGAKQRAADRGLPFDLDIDWALNQLDAQNLKCALTSIPFLSECPADSYRNPYAPSLDRISPKDGYTRGNVRIVILAINVMLMDWGAEIFERVVAGYHFTRPKNRSLFPHHLKGAGQN